MDTITHVAVLLKVEKLRITPIWKVVIRKIGTMGVEYSN